MLVSHIIVRRTTNSNLIKAVADQGSLRFLSQLSYILTSSDLDRSGIKRRCDHNSSTNLFKGSVDGMRKLQYAPQGSTGSLSKVRNFHYSPWFKFSPARQPDTAASSSEISPSSTLSAEQLDAPRPLLWQPSKERIQASEVNQFRLWINEQHQIELRDYHALHEWSITHLAEFWESVRQFTGIQFHTDPVATLELGDTLTSTRWFPGAMLNFAENLLLKGESHPDKVALVSYLETGEARSLTFSELKAKSAQFADYLRQLDVKPGDRVAAIMPNTLETVVAMLATTSVGAIWTSCSPDFGHNSILDRFGQTEPKVLIAANGYYYKGKSIELAERVAAIGAAIPSIIKTVTVPIIPVASGSRQSSTAMIDWQQALSEARTSEPRYESLPFNHPAYILYSSGTTGAPKCIVHSAGGTLLQHAKELQLHTDVTEKDNLFYFTTCGWMMWNWAVSTLQTGATTVLFDGNPFYPKPETLVSLIEKENISVFGASARYFAELEKEGVIPAESFDLSSLKTLLSTGSPLSKESFHYIYNEFKSDVCVSSISGGTDIISCFALGNPTLPVYEEELQCLGLGMAVDVFDDAGQSIQDEKGELVCTQPFPSMPVGFWKDYSGQRYHKAYFEKYVNNWAQGDLAERCSITGGLVIYGRSDSVLNPSGVRIGSAEIYRQLKPIKQISEAVVVDQEWGGDKRIVLFVKLAENVQLDAELRVHIKQTIRNNTTPRHVPAVIAQVPDVPKTYSGKLVEGAVKKVIHGEEVENLEAIFNPECLKSFRNHLDLKP